MEHREGKNRSRDEADFATGPQEGNESRVERRQVPMSTGRRQAPAVSSMVEAALGA